MNWANVGGALFALGIAWAAVLFILYGPRPALLGLLVASVGVVLAGGADG